MLKHGGGKIINTASMAAVFVPHPQKQIAYNASKAAVVKITETLGTEWADRNVRVNCISPGIVNTALITVTALHRHYVKRLTLSSLHMCDLYKLKKLGRLPSLSMLPSLSSSESETS